MRAAYQLFMADGLMKAGLPPRDLMRALGLDSALIGCVEKYSPDQPRVPAGNGRPSGQWTRDAEGNGATPASSIGLETARYRRTNSESSGSGGTGSNNEYEPAEISVAIRQPSRPGRVLSDANPEPIKPGARYAQIAIGKIPYKGDPRIDSTTTALVDLLAYAASSIPKGVGPLYGTALHLAFANAVRAANLPGIGVEGVEQSFDLQGVAKYGAAGSIRTDVSLWDDVHKNVIAIYDLKTGGAELTNARVRQLTSMAPRSNPADVPTVFELRLELRKPK